MLKKEFFVQFLATRKPLFNYSYLLLPRIVIKQIQFRAANRPQNRYKTHEIKHIARI